MEGTNNFGLMSAGILGGLTHVYLSKQGANSDMVNAKDVFIIGLAGGLLGGIALQSYRPASGLFMYGLAGLGGMVAFDYFLFDL